MNRSLNFLIVAIVVLGLSACASQPSTPKADRAPADPWEPLNRQLEGFNHGFDSVTFKPLAKGYDFLPRWMRTGVGNFSSNLRTPLNIINNFLQGKPKAGFSETGRFLMNSTLGLAGFLDVATDAGLEKKREDFGQTFAVWGVPDGPYVIVPFLGPFTLRDALALPLNIMADPLIWYDNSSVRDKIYFVRLIDLRSRLFPVEELIEKSPDRYIGKRDIYLQNRRFRIYDGDPPVDEDEEEFEFVFDDDEE